MIPRKEQAHKACTEICTTFLTPLISFGLSKNCRFMRISNVLKYKLIDGLKFGTCHILTFSVHFLTICDHICRRFQIRRTIHSERLPRYEEATGEDLFWSFSWHWWPQANHPRQGLLRHAFIKQKQWPQVLDNSKGVRKKYLKSTEHKKGQFKK